MVVFVGEEGDHMFVLNEGTCDCFIERDGEEVLVKVRQRSNMSLTVLDSVQKLRTAKIAISLPPLSIA